MSYYMFGLQRSGTNFLTNLIKINFAKDIQNTQSVSWKHSIEDPVGYDKNVPTIIIHKNPYTWVESISMRNKVDWIGMQKKYHALEKTTEEFTIGPNKMNLTNLMMTYRDFHNNWLNRSDIPNYLVIKYEDLLKEDTRNAVLERIEQTFGWERVRPDWRLPVRGTVSQSKDYTEEREKYYIEGIPQNLNREHIHEINRVMEIWPIHGMGYTIL